jgi:hypothetical protein
MKRNVTETTGSTHMILVALTSSTGTQTLVRTHVSLRVNGAIGDSTESNVITSVSRETRANGSGGEKTEESVNTWRIRDISVKTGSVARKRVRVRNLAADCQIEDREGFEFDKR